MIKRSDRNKQARRDAERAAERSAQCFRRLTNRIFVNSIDDDALDQELAAWVNGVKLQGIGKELRSLCQIPRIAARLIPFPANTSLIDEAPFFRINDEKTASFLHASFNVASGQIKTFQTLSSEFERSLIKGEYGNAHGVLTAIENALGHSLWSIRARLTTYALNGELAQLETFSEKCKASINSPYYSYLITRMLLIATDPFTYIERIILKTIRELNEAGEYESADLHTLIFVPTPLLGEAKYLNCLQQINGFPLIDRYVLFRALLANNRAIRAVEDVTTPPGVCAVAEHSRANSLIRRYEACDYGEFLAEYVLSFGEESDVDISLLNLATKATLIGNAGSQTFNKNGLLRATEFITQLYRPERNPAQAIRELAGIAIRYGFLPSAPVIQLALYKAIPHYYSAKERRLAVIKADLAGRHQSPWSRTLAAPGDPDIRYRYLSPEAELPPVRQLKQRIRILTSETPLAYSDKIHPLLKQYEKLSSLEKDYYELASAVMVHCEAIEDLLNLAAVALSRNSNFYPTFPMKLLVSHIETKSTSTIDAIVVLAVYAKNIDNEKTYLLNETFEEFLFQSGVKKPSELFNTLTPADERTACFYRHVCTVETMDFLGCFNSSNELRAERVKILDFLKEAGAIDSTTHREEVDEIVGQVVVDSAATEFGIHKIDVNDAAIKKNVIDEVTSLLTVYRSSGNKEEKFIAMGETSRSDGRTLVAGDKNTTLLKILTLVRDTFLYDEKYGLDRNLSTEIRHGFFSNLMRSRLEEAHLITEVGDDGQYKRNEYWSEANSFLIKDVYDRVDSHLRWFSAEFNKLIAQAEEWMKITCNKRDEPERIFDYSVYLSEFERLRAIVNKGATPEEFIDDCIRSLWRETETAIFVMREKINVELKSVVDCLFDQLISKINDAKGGAALLDLCNAITQTKNDIREDITVIAEWFKRSESIAVRRHTLRELIGISTECFDRVHGHRLLLTLSIDKKVGLVQFYGQYTKPFVVALINLFENALRHSGRGSQTDLEITARGSADRWSIEISNDLTEARERELKKGGLTQARARLASSSASHLTRVEGGSGLCKAASQLHQIDEGLKLTIDLKSGRFVARINHD